MNNYIIVIVGCDGQTAVEKELDDEQLKLMVELAKEFNKNSDYDCQPRMSIVTTEGEEIYKHWNHNDVRGVGGVDVIEKYKVKGI